MSTTMTFEANGYSLKRPSGIKLASEVRDVTGRMPDGVSDEDSRVTFIWQRSLAPDLQGAVRDLMDRYRYEEL